MVTLTGNNFSTTPTNNIVYFGATRAIVTTASENIVTAIVPKGATYAPITLLNTEVGLAAYSIGNFTPTYSPAKYDIRGNHFLPKQDFVTGTNPGSVAIGDLDGDGKPDLAVANQGSNTVSVFRNISGSGRIVPGSFANKVDFTTGTNPVSVAIGDVDGDGKPDLAIVNRGSNTVSVLRNTATSGSITTGSFAARVDFATGASPNAVAIGDIDGNGKPDLAVANQGSNTVSVLRNTSGIGSISAGSFAARVDFPTGTSPHAVAMGDLDGDSKPDLVVTNRASHTVSVLRNNAIVGIIGAGSFAFRVDFTTGTNPVSIAICDIDGDYYSDLAVLNQGSHSVSVLRNSGNVGYIGFTSFESKVDFTTGTNPVSLAVGDLDGDSKPDLAVANQVANTVSVFRNIAINGNISAGSFAAKVDFPAGTTPISLNIGDLDGDSKPDLAAANNGSNSVSVLRNADLPPTVSSFTPISGKPGDTITISGTNLNPTAANNLVLFGATRATIPAATANSITAIVPAGATYAPITLFDTVSGLAANSRGKFIPTYSPAKKTITTADFSPGQNFTNGFPYRFSSIAIADLDGDGKPDLVTTNMSPNVNKNTVSIFRNTSSSGSIGPGSFDARVDIQLGGDTPHDVAIGDLDGDGKPDLAMALQFGIVVIRNTSSSGSIGAGNFDSRLYIELRNRPFSVAIDDLDGDGKPDLAVANFGMTGYTGFDAGSVTVFRNTSTIGSLGKGSFAAGQDFVLGKDSYTSSIAIGDLDGDGKPDLAVTNCGPNTVSVFRNTATTGSLDAGSFAARQDFSLGSKPVNYLFDFSQIFAYSIAIGDLDGDGKFDLIVANNSVHNVSVFRNTSTVGSIGSGSFAARVDFATFNNMNPASLSLGDLNGDGKPDLAVGGRYLVSVYQNTSSSGSIDAGSFAPRQDFITNITSAFVAIGDVDGDAKPDLAFTNENQFLAQQHSFISVKRNADNVFTFTGSGNWDNAANWAGNTVPPLNIPPNVQININPAEVGECILNVPVTVSSSASITVAPGKKFIIQGNLTINNP
jgi:hypothetical protein